MSIYCPDCGWPKHVHSVDKSVPAARLPKTPATKRRLCETVLANPEEVDKGGAPIMVADRELYRRRLAIYEMEREERFL